MSKSDKVSVLIEIGHEKIEVNSSIAGLGFLIEAIIKFKQHKDNPPIKIILYR
ncbi:hypothetical protein NDK43_26820 [Neobacillus pocheonensis]|uniref:Uncharacterized protein n=1 Tax=Neobacillus pocheonensis TaxID=363869 RepID=A0ABT0WG56_9BACI|nr:hypothetical protein [Neobacillus pocheonensis]